MNRVSDVEVLMSLVGREPTLVNGFWGSALEKLPPMRDAKPKTLEFPPPESEIFSKGDAQSQTMSF